MTSRHEFKPDIGCSHSVYSPINPVLDDLPLERETFIHTDRTFGVDLNDSGEETDDEKIRQRPCQLCKSFGDDRQLPLRETIPLLYLSNLLDRSD